MPERLARPIRDEDRICFCGDSLLEHDEHTGECLYCECERFTEDVDTTMELLEEDA